MTRSYWWVGLGLLASCGSDTPTIAGGGSDQPNKIQMVRVMDVEGNPAVGARMVSWAGTWDPKSSSVHQRLDSGFTDSTGRWRTSVPLSGWYVTAQSHGQFGVCLPQRPEINLGEPAPVAGQARAAGGLSLDGLWLGGFGSALVRDQTDSFKTISDTGVRRLWGVVSWGERRRDTLLLGIRHLVARSNPAFDLVADTGSVLLFSAEDELNGSALRGLAFDWQDPRFTGWYGNNTSDLLSVGGGLDQLSDDRGRYLHLVMSDSASAVSSARRFRIGFPLSVRSLDWTGVTGLQMRFAPGMKGNFIVRIWTERTDALADRRPLQMTIRQPWNTWDTTLLLRLSDFRPAVGSEAERRELTWERIRSGVVRLTIEGIQADAATLELREIRAQGNRWQRW